MADLPRLLLIADGFATGRPELGAAAIRERCRAIVEAGVPWVSLRDHDAPDDRFREHAEALAADFRRANPDVRLSVHARLDVAVDLRAGIHVGRRGASLGEAMAAGLAGPVGVSAHSVRAAGQAAKAGADYVTFSSVFATQTHPDAVPAGIGRLRLVSEQTRIPVLALGGITPSRARLGRTAGAHGAAVVSALLCARDIPGTVGQFLAALED